MLVETDNLVSMMAAARALDSHDWCVHRWAKSGRLGRVVWISGHRFVLKAGIRQFLEKQREPKNNGKK